MENTGINIYTGTKIPWYKSGGSPKAKDTDVMFWFASGIYTTPQRSSLQSREIEMYLLENLELPLKTNVGECQTSSLSLSKVSISEVPVGRDRELEAPPLIIENPFPTKKKGSAEIQG